MENNNHTEKIHIEDEDIHNEEQDQTWTEEFKVAGEKLADTVKKLVHEAAVRRIVIVNEERGIHFEVPLTLGLAGIALLPVYASIGLIALLVVDCTIMVERKVMEKEPEEAAENGPETAAA